jgi:type IV pilus assembly protein PilA
MAVASLVLGILWLLGFGSIAAVVLGHLSRRRAAHEGRPKSGLALAGLILGYLGTVFLVVGVLAAIAIPVFLNQRQLGYQASVKADLRSVANAEESYNTDNGRYAPVEAGIAGQATVRGGATVPLSAGNTITSTTITRAGFCLDASNPLTTVDRHYGSAAGGLAPAPAPEAHQLSSNSSIARSPAASRVR